MTPRTHLRPEAGWYEKQRNGLGHEFLDEVLSACELISENPNMYPVVHRHTRRAIVQRFPFGIYYRVEEESIIIVAVMHGSPHPKRWQQRK